MEKESQGSKRIYFIYQNEDMNDTIKIIKSLKVSDVLIDGVIL